MEKRIPLIFAADDYYIPYMSVMIQSILENAVSGYYYEIILLTKQISKKFEDLLRKQIHKFDHFSLRIINISKIISQNHFYTVNQNNARFTSEAYFRLFAPYILPEYDRAIYLDGDMVALVDVAKLWEIEIGDCYVGAVRDFCGLSDVYDPNSTRKEYMEDVIGLEDVNDYFISGLLIMNFKKFREEFTFEQIMDIATSIEWKFHDQDILNVIVGYKRLLLPANWNVLQDYGNHHYLPRVIYDEWRISTEKPYIIHYGGPYKPWLMPRVPRAKFFWKYAKLSMFYNEIKERLVSQLKEDWIYFLKYISLCLFPYGSHSRKMLKHLIGFLRRSILGKG